MGRIVDAIDRVCRWGQRVLEGRAVRRLWLVGASLVAVPMLLVGCYQVVTLVAQEERVERRTVDAAGLTGVDVEGAPGTVRVIGVAGATTVEVRSRVRDGLRATGYRVFVRGDRLVVRSSCPNFGSSWCNVSSTIEVPSGLAVSVHGDGRIEVSDVQGGVDASTDSSSIVLSRVGGAVTATSDQGRIEGSDLTADAVVASADQGSIQLAFTVSPRTVEAEADQGSITILLPDQPGVSYATSVGADQGSASAPIRQDPGSDRAIAAHADQGDVTVAYVTG
ncbi:MAG TPA: hypothetical protein VFI47_01100 [Acidimicrobiales bacterium]|nr:hypothetical protein [Acidimicrobiales bacterium]